MLRSIPRSRRDELGFRPCDRLTVLGDPRELDLLIAADAIRQLGQRYRGREVLARAQRGAVVATQEALAALSDELALDPERPGEAAQLLLSVIGLCWFPLVHSKTMLRALGINATTPEFLQARKRHVIDLVLSGTLGRSQS